jgi:geranylgeranyl diphosphate synthase type II
VLEGKRTLMLIHLLSSAKSRDKAWLCEFLGEPRHERCDADVRRVFALMEKHGSLEYGAMSARFLAGAALSEFDTAYGALPDSDEKRFIRDIVLYMIERDL